MQDHDHDARLSAVRERGVLIVDARQTFIAPDVVIERLAPGAVLHPGTRLHGARTLLGERAEIGRQGPVTLVDTLLDADARIDSGYAEGAVLLQAAHAGANAHLREGTLMEEQSSTAHCVGLKQTILMSFATLGSLINFCDVLLAGGTSRDDHSEVGSGAIHFNFTPWGSRGDKATPSLLGDVVRGVFLRERRIFVGGASGIVGPRRVGYGSVIAAGQVLRTDVAEGRVFSSGARAVDKPHDATHLDDAVARGRKNLAYLGQLAALHAWYKHVRRVRAGLTRASAFHIAVLDAAVELIERSVEIRMRCLDAFLRERGEQGFDFALNVEPACPLAPRREDPAPHIDWVRALPPSEVIAMQGWLGTVVSDAYQRMPAHLRPVESSP